MDNKFEYPTTRSIVDNIIYTVKGREVTGYYISWAVERCMKIDQGEASQASDTHESINQVLSDTPSLRGILASQQRRASREIEDLRIVLAMLPAEPTHEQEQAFVRLFLKDAR